MVAFHVIHVQITVNAPTDDFVKNVEDVLDDDLVRTTTLLSRSVSNISHRAADRLHTSDGAVCGQQINELLQASPVQFASASFVVGASNDPLLREVAQILQECADSDFTIAGHTDSDGGEEYNQILSFNRVNAVRAALGRLGVSADRLQTHGFGENSPIATNATEAGNAANRRVEFIVLDEVDATVQACDAGGQLSGNLNGGANDQDGNLTGNFGSNGYNCATGVRTETWGDLSVSHEEDRGTTGMATFGISKETQANNMLRGRFIEGYLSRDNVETENADGTITGAGLHAGLYRAQGLEGGLALSYYGSLAVGYHHFELDVGTQVDGNYTFAGLFAGAALGGERAIGSVIIKPSVGVDLAYSEAIGSEISVPGTLDIDPANLARGFVELGLEQTTDTGAIAFAPPAFCESNQDDASEACGFGVAFAYMSAADVAGASWDIALDYEQIDATQTASFSVARSQQIFDGLGVSRSSFGASAQGALQAEQTFKFTW